MWMPSSRASTAAGSSVARPTLVRGLGGGLRRGNCHGIGSRGECGRPGGVDGGHPKPGGGGGGGADRGGMLGGRRVPGGGGFSMLRGGVRRRGGCGGGRVR